MSPKSYKRLIFALIAVLLLVLLCVIPVAAQDSTAQADSGSVLIFANNLDPTTLDPDVSDDAQSNIFKLGFYEGLVRWATDGKTIEPSLATSWDTSSDGLTWTFHLRQGVKFHDGTVMDADAVKFSIDRMKTVNQGLAFTLANVASVDVVDANTVKFTLSQPDITFFQGLPGIPVMSPTTFQPHMDDKNATEFAFDHESGTGPYTLTSWTRGSRVEIQKFDDYWGGWSQPHVDRFVELIVPEAETRHLMLERGDIDLLPKLEDQVNDIPAIQVNSALTIDTFPSQSIVYEVMSNVKGPLADVRVRQAISYAFDYDAALQVAFGGVAKQARGPLSSSLPYFDPDLFQYHRDLDKAKQLLTEAGYPNGFQIQFGYVGSSSAQTLTEGVLQSSLADVGITIVPQAQTFAALLTAFQNPDTAPDMFNLNNHSEYPDPDFTLSRFFSIAAQGTGGDNGGYYTNKDVDALIAQGRTTSDPTQRADIYKKIQEQIVADAPAIWVAETQFIVGHKSNVKGIEYIPAFDRTLGYLNSIYIDQ